MQIFSSDGWVMDPVLFHNQGVRLMYEEGKTSGKYVEIRPVSDDTEISMGVFEDAGPYITDAVFWPLVTLKVSETTNSNIIAHIAAHKGV